MQLISGKVRTYYDENRVFDMLIKNKLVYFYLSHSQAKKLEIYLSLGNYVTFYATDKPIFVGNVYAYQVVDFDKIYKMQGNKEIVYYNHQDNVEQVKKLLRKDTYRLFLDLEFSMPPVNYHHGDIPQFHAEIVEYGMCLEDANGNIIDSSYGLVKPLDERGINEYTLNFIHKTENELKNASYYSKFYNTLKDYMTLYQPIIYVWGRNDYLIINKSYLLHKVTPITERKNYINLMQLFKTYYKEKNDIGLYNAYDYFGKKPILDEQDHNALHDAEATLELFHLFDKTINK